MIWAIFAILVLGLLLDPHGKRTRDHGLTARTLDLDRQTSIPGGTGPGRPDRIIEGSIPEEWKSSATGLRLAPSPARCYFILIEEETGVPPPMSPG